MLDPFDPSADPAIKTYRDGTHRLISPSQTLARVSSRLPEMGITRVANVTGLDRIGIPVIMVTRPNARSIAVSQGKGLDLAAAKASGVMEAIEIFHAETIRLPLRLAAHEEMRGSAPLLDLGRLPQSAASLYHPHHPMLWIEGVDLLSRTPVWLPYETVHANFTLPLPPGSGFFGASTNGLASGNHRLEAACHALCEVIERDAVTLWRRLPDAAADRTRLDLATVDDPGCREVLRLLQLADLEIAAWDVTSDLGIPAFYAALLDRRQEISHPGIGAGCHLAAEVALLRALTEAVQVRMTYITGARDDLSPDEFTPLGRARKLDPVRALMRRAKGSRSFEQVAAPPVGASFAADLALVLERLRHAGVDQVAAVDLTREDFGIAVVKVVVPGLEGPDDHQDFLPGARAAAMEAGVA